jgi:hypothetical protein
MFDGLSQLVGLPVLWQSCRCGTQNPVETGIMKALKVTHDTVGMRLGHWQTCCLIGWEYSILARFEEALANDYFHSSASTTTCVGDCRLQRLDKWKKKRRNEDYIILSFKLARYSTPRISFRPPASAMQICQLCYSSSL